MIHLMSKQALGRWAAGATLAAAACAPAWAHRYTIVDLGVPQAVKLNSHGGIAGSAYGLHALVYRGGAWHTLPDGSDDSYAMGINELSQVVGVEQIPGVRDLAVVWGPDKTKTVLPMPHNGWNGYAAAISDTGLVTGTWSTPSLVFSRCFLWAPGLGSVDLGLLGHGTTCWAHDVNVFGQVVGEAPKTPRGNPRAFIWQAGRMREIGTLGGDWATATAVNALGDVVGSSNTARDHNEWHAWHWRNGTMTDIGTSAAYGANHALGINLAGEIVGYGVRLSAGQFRAVRFDHGEIVDLSDEVDDLGDWWLEFAYAINDKGDILGNGNRPDGAHAFLLVRQRN